MTALHAVLEELLSATRASRVTLRRDLPGETAFPVVEEALAAGVATLRGEHSVHLPTQPVVQEVEGSLEAVPEERPLAVSGCPKRNGFELAKRFQGVPRRVDRIPKVQQV